MAENVIVNWWAMEGSAVGFGALAAISVQCGPRTSGGKNAMCCYLLARGTCSEIAAMELV